MKKLNITMVVMSVCFFSSCSCSTSKGSQEPSIPAHTHYWNDPVWSWNEDNTEARATFECSTYKHYHVETAKKSDDQIKIETVIKADHYQDGEDAYIGEVLFNGAYYRSPVHYVKTYKSEHVFNEYGVCEEDEEFLYPENEIEYDFEPYYYNRQLEAKVDLTGKLKKAGDVVYYKWPVQYRGHAIRLSDLTDLEEDEITLTAKTFGVFEELETYDYHHLQGNNVFIRVTAKNDKTNPSFVFHEDHNLNEVNLCPHCETYYGIRLIPGQVARFDMTAGEKSYLRCQAWPGCKYRLTIGEKLTGHEDDFSFYTVDKYFDPHPYSLSDEYPEDPWKDEEYGRFTYIYVVINATVSGDASLIIDQL